MKEIVDADYVVEVGYARLPDAVHAYLPDSYEIRLNQCVDVIVLSWLPDAPWPDRVPFDEEEVTSREDAAWLAAGQWGITVVPAADGRERLEQIARTEVDGLVNVLVWMSPMRHARLQTELSTRLDMGAALLDRSSTGGVPIT